MISELATKLILSAVIVAALSGGAYTTYSHIKSVGYNEAVAECNAKTKAYEASVNKKLEEIASSSTTLTNESRQANIALTEGISTIIKTTKGKTLTIIKNGECNPSPTFSDSFRQINERVNQSIKDKKP